MPTEEEGQLFAIATITIAFGTLVIIALFRRLPFVYTGIFGMLILAAAVAASGGLALGAAVVVLAFITLYAAAGKLPSGGAGLALGTTVGGWNRAKLVRVHAYEMAILVGAYLGLWFGRSLFEPWLDNPLLMRTGVVFLGEILVLLPTRGLLRVMILPKLEAAAAEAARIEAEADAKAGLPSPPTI